MIFSMARAVGFLNCISVLHTSQTHGDLMFDVSGVSVLQTPLGPVGRLIHPVPGQAQ